MNIVYSLTDNQIRDLHKLYKNEWWTKTRTLKETKAGVEGSQICVGLIDDKEELIGFARALTDYIFKALILDVIVAPNSRKLGLGDRLMSLVTNHPDLSNVKHFELYCRPEMFAYYNKFGFSEELGDIKLMRHIHN